MLLNRCWSYVHAHLHCADVMVEFKSLAFNNAHRPTNNAMERQVLATHASYGYPINTHVANCTPPSLKTILRMLYPGMEKVAAVEHKYYNTEECAYVGVEAEMISNGGSWESGKHYGRFCQTGGFRQRSASSSAGNEIRRVHNILRFERTVKAAQRDCATTPKCEPKNKTVVLNYFFKMSVHLEKVVCLRRCCVCRECHRRAGNIGKV